MRSITPLETEKALADGADMVGETFIFGVSGGILVWEYNRTKEKEKAKEAEKIAKQKEESYRRNKTPVSMRQRMFCLMNDYKTAFDRVNRTILLKKLDDMGMPRQMIKMI